MNTVKQSSRLLSLDILRGITIAGMIMVNNPGAWRTVYAPLKHVSWNGLTPTDLVFPFFMFIMGVSTFMSLRKYQFKLTKESFGKVAYRTFMIFFIGLALAWFGMFSGGLARGESIITAATGHFDTIRIMGVLQRLGLAYGLSAFIALVVKPKHIIWSIVAILASYSLILIFGNGFDRSENNIISIVDKAIVGTAHMYKDYDVDGNRIFFDPEGILSTLPSVAHVLIGFLFGKMIVSTKDNHKRVEKMLIWGTILAFSGLLLQYGLPINKKVWSTTFVLVTTGFAAQLLALLIWVIDINKKDKWTKFFHAFGINPLFIYVLAGVLANLLSEIKVIHLGSSISIKEYVYNVLIQPWAGSYFGSLVYSLSFVTVCWMFGYILYKRNIFIKI